MEHLPYLIKRWPSASATPAMVTSSGVGPKPPDVSTTSYAPDSALTSDAIASTSSRMHTICTGRSIVKAPQRTFTQTEAYRQQGHGQERHIQEE